MKTATITWIVIAIVIVLALWYWMANSHTSNTQTNQIPATTSTEITAATSTPTASPTTQPAAAAVLAASTSATLGQYIVAPNGTTLYSYAKDTPGVSNCSDTCAITWPPYTVPATTPLTGTADTTGKIALINRGDGTMQITYNGTPLYYYIKDTKPGDTTGQGVGGIWYVVKP